MITSSKNPLMKQVRRLRQRKYRQREGAFFVEGLHVVLTAMEKRAPIQTLIYAPDLLTSQPAYEMIETQRTAGVRCEPITAELFSALSNRDNPMGLGAIVGWSSPPLSAFTPTAESIYIGLHNIADPGNLGTVLRTADALGVAGVILVGQTTEPTHPAAVKASMGTLFTVPVTAVADLEMVWAWTNQHNVHTYATTAHAETASWAASYPTPLLLLMGSEKFGLPDEALNRAEQTIRIPMRGHASSLNLGIATAMVLYEATRPH